MEPRDMKLKKPGVLSFSKKIEQGDIYIWIGDDNVSLQGMVFKKGYSIEITEVYNDDSGFEIRKNRQSGFTISRSNMKNLVDERIIIKAAPESYIVL